MEQQSISIDGIPAILWGPKGDKLFIAVHGDQSSKADTVIEIFAQEAVLKGCQVLSFDLPEHGDRKDGPVRCKPPACTADLRKVLAFAQTQADKICLFGCSIGAYFSMLAYGEEAMAQALFLSPIVDMKRVIENMMEWFHVSPARLEQEKEIPTPINPLDWAYYQYVLSHPIRWHVPTAILYGTKDFLCEREVMDQFVRQTGAKLTTIEGGEHFVSTEEQLAMYREWLRIYIRI